MNDTFKFEDIWNTKKESGRMSLSFERTCTLEIYSLDENAIEVLFHQLGALCSHTPKTSP